MRNRIKLLKSRLAEEELNTSIFNELKIIAKSVGEENTSILIQSNYNDLKSGKQIGKISEDDYRIKCNKIIQRVLTFLDDLEQKHIVN